jgi:hypothetical protein
LIFLGAGRRKRQVSSLPMWYNCDTCARKILNTRPQPLENTQEILRNYEVKLKKFSLLNDENQAASASRHHAAGKRRREHSAKLTIFLYTAALSLKPSSADSITSCSWAGGPLIQRAPPALAQHSGARLQPDRESPPSPMTCIGWRKAFPTEWKARPCGRVRD